LNTQNSQPEILGHQDCENAVDLKFTS